MVEPQNDKASVNDTGVLSKESKVDWGDAQGETTDYWDISGGSEMDLASHSGTMKIEILQKSICDNDNVNPSTAEGIAMARKTTYCENEQSAMKRNPVDENGNLKYNHNNNNNNFSNPYAEDISNNGPSCEHVDIGADDNKNCNTMPHQTSSHSVGIKHDNGEGPENDVNHTVSDNIDTSGAKDNCADDDNKAPLSIREVMLQDAECIEERFRIDRKKLEQMLQAATEGRGQTGEAFFQTIMDETQTFITWPSKLKIGAKSKKDPHIRICGKPDRIKEARQRIMACLDTKSNRVTVKMDVSHTEHSHVIGKGGNNIKRVMQETGCHIHFPDSNRNTAGEKSNQVSITGHPEGVENARLKIRTLLPIVLQFEIPNNGLPIPDLNSPLIKHLVLVNGISIQFKQRAKVYSTSCTVRGSADNTEGLKAGIQTLMNHIAGSQLPATTQIEIAPQHHNYMLSKSGVNVTSITQATGARIIFPDPSALPKKSTVYVSGSVDSVILARHKLMGCLPLLLMFDTKEDSSNASNDSLGIASLMESLEVSINIKSKPKQPSKTVIIKGLEYNIYNMFEARAKILGLDSSGVVRPSQSMSPKLNRNPVMTPTPVILLSHSHVPTPTVQAAVIGIPEQKTATPITNVVLGGQNYVLTRNISSNAPTPRPLSTVSTVQTPSQSPFPTLHNAPINMNHSKAEHFNDDLRRNSYDIANQIASPLLVNRNTNQYHTVNVTTAEDMQRHIDRKLGIMGNQSVPMVGSNQQGSQNNTGFQQSNFHPLYMNGGNSYENGRVMMSPPYEPNGFHSVQRVDGGQMDQKIHNQNTGRFGNGQGIITDEEYLRHQLGITKHHGMPNSIDTANNTPIRTSPQPNRMTYNPSVTSPDSITESRASLTSNRNSPVISGRNPRITAGFDHFEESVVTQVSPSGSSVSGFQSLANRDLSNISPISNPHRSPQIVLTQNSQGTFDSNGITSSGDLTEISSGPPPGFEGFTPSGTPIIKTTDYDDLYKRAKKAMENKPVQSEVRTPTDIWSGYGFSKSMPFEMKEELKKLAASSKGNYRTNLPTTYENGESGRNQPSPVEEEGEYSTENTTPNHLRVPSNTSKGNSSLAAWRRRRMENMALSFGGNMGMNYMSTVQRPTPQKHSAFTIVNPNESLNRPNNSPSHSEEMMQQPQRHVLNSPFANSGNESTLASLSDKQNCDNRTAMNSTPSIQDSLGLSVNSAVTSTKVEPDISDVLNRLELSKYIQVFQQQEVDYQTFLTLTDSDLKELGITVFGPRKKILLAIKDLNGGRDVFGGAAGQDTPAHENISDQMLQLQRLQLQQQRDNPQTTAPSRMDPHPLLSPSRQMFNPPNQRMQNHMDRHGMNARQTDRIRSSTASRLWQNARHGGSASGHW